MREQPRIRNGSPAHRQVVTLVHGQFPSDIFVFHPTPTTGQVALPVQFESLLQQHRICHLSFLFFHQLVILCTDLDVLSCYSEQRSTPVQISGAFSRVHDPIAHARRARCLAHVGSIVNECVIVIIPVTNRGAALMLGGGVEAVPLSFPLTRKVLWDRTPRGPARRICTDQWQPSVTIVPDAVQDFALRRLQCSRGARSTSFVALM